jgi:hypothetical protein
MARASLCRANLGRTLASSKRGGRSTDEPLFMRLSGSFHVERPSSPTRRVPTTNQDAAQSTIARRKVTPEIVLNGEVLSEGIVPPAPAKNRDGTSPRRTSCSTEPARRFMASASLLSRAELPATCDRGKNGRHARFRLSSCAWAMRAPPGSPQEVMRRRRSNRPHASPVTYLCLLPPFLFDQV